MATWRCRVCGIAISGGSFLCGAPECYQDWCYRLRVANSRVGKQRKEYMWFHKKELARQSWHEEGKL